MPTIKELVSDVMAAPIGELIAAVGQGVADAQQALDRGSLAQILEIYSHADSDELKLLQQIGYQPTFYALPETTGEIQVSAVSRRRRPALRQSRCRPSRWPATCAPACRPPACTPPR